MGVDGAAGKWVCHDTGSLHRHPASNRWVGPDEHQ